MNPIPKSILQKTTKQPVSTTGIGLHSGKRVKLDILPAPENTGIVFFRDDLDPSIGIACQAQNVIDTRLATTLAHPDHPQIRVLTIEHLMSAVAGLGIDNLHIHINAPEIPIMDGSASSFVYLLHEAGLQFQNHHKRFIKILKPIEIVEGDKWAKLKPFFGFKASFKIDFNHPAIDDTGDQFDIDFGDKTFVKHVARARTFGFIHEVETLRGMGLARGGSLSNAIVMDEYKILNPEGLRFSDEFVRHKTLDAIGDLSVIGGPILGEYSAYKSGHAINNLLIRKVLEDESNFSWVSFPEHDEAPTFAQQLMLVN